MANNEGQGNTLFVALWQWLSLWAIVFVLTVSILAVLHLVPPEINETGKFVFSSLFGSDHGLKPLGVMPLSTNVPTTTPEDSIETAAQPEVLPVRIVIDDIGVDSAVENPKSSDEAVLDQALLQGVVRYPSSGSLLDDKNILLFGHSSYLPVVHNQAYKAFNRLSELALGNYIKVYSLKNEYLFKVVKIEAADAEDALVRFSGGKKRLVLSTCDSFGKKTDRFVVEAEFVSSNPI